MHVIFRALKPHANECNLKLSQWTNYCTRAFGACKTCLICFESLATALNFYLLQKQRRNYFHILRWSFRCLRVLCFISILLFEVCVFECDRNFTDANILHVSSFWRRRKYCKGPIPYLGHWGRAWAFVTIFVLVLRICLSVPHTWVAHITKTPFVVNVPYLLLSRHGL